MAQWKHAWCVWFLSFLAKCLFLRHFCQDHKIHHTFLFCCIKPNYKTVETSVKQRTLLPSWTVNGAVRLFGRWVAVLRQNQTGPDWNQCGHTFLLHKGGDLWGLWPGKEPLYKHYHLCHLETLHSIPRCSKVLVKKWHPELCCEKCAS